jgi:hypothetical protein
MIKVTVGWESTDVINHIVIHRVAASVKFAIAKLIEKKQIPDMEIDVNIEIKEASDATKRKDSG